jgi:hypothetical protein
MPIHNIITSILSQHLGLDFTKAPQEQVRQVIMKWRNWVDELNNSVYVRPNRGEF